ncbi:Gag protein [Phytophthora palmivora]|uniref:Gag protein n=1 Tax=Phytophthora palmivora TaxID=4796 RepID=A0A2P4XT85_9STRA|nr:Gag protein [Phytophthora palmivora]
MSVVNSVRNLAAATPAEQVERIEAFNMTHFSRAGPMVGLKPAQPNLLRLKVNPYEGKGGVTSTSGSEK